MIKSLWSLRIKFRIRTKYDRFLTYFVLQTTFSYGSSSWSNKTTYYDNSYGRDGGLDNRQYKGSAYWKTSFKEICVGMKYNGTLRAFSISYPASSLYDLIADGTYRPTHLGRNKWKSLISGSSLQLNCNREGFNVYHSNTRARLGIVSNQENDCETPDSLIGLGIYRGGTGNVAGNVASSHYSPDNGGKNLKVMGYILVRWNIRFIPEIWFNHPHISTRIRA